MSCLVGKLRIQRNRERTRLHLNSHSLSGDSSAPGSSLYRFGCQTQMQDIKHEIKHVFFVRLVLPSVSDASPMSCLISVGRLFIT